MKYLARDIQLHHTNKIWPCNFEWRIYSSISSSFIPRDRSRKGHGFLSTLPIDSNILGSCKIAQNFFYLKKENKKDGVFNEKLVWKNNHNSGDTLGLEFDQGYKIIFAR